jgi:hypothetical protein
VEEVFPIAREETDPAKDRIGRAIAVAISHAVTEDVFLNELEYQALLLKTGDTEVLLSDLLSPTVDHTQYQKSAGPISPREALLNNLPEGVTERDVDNFLTANPSQIVAVRGDLVGFVERTDRMPVYYMPDNFDEGTTSVTGSVTGIDTTIGLSERLDIPVIVLQTSERHDHHGDLLQDRQTVVNPGGVGTDPSTGDPTFSDCPVPANILRGFTVQSVNGGVRLDYDIDFSRLGSATVEITVHRQDPISNRETLIGTFDRSSVSTFNDPTLNASINTDYVYILRATILAEDENGFDTECDATTTGGERSYLTDNAVANGTLARVESFVGENLDDHTILYTWHRPAGVAVTQYRLTVVRNGNLEEVAVINAGTSQDESYTYVYPAEMMGQKIRMQVQYRNAGGDWTGDYYDLTYGSFRKGDEPLKYYGIRADQIAGGVANLDRGENQLNGAPEIRVVVARARTASPNDEAELTETTIQTINCCLQQLRTCSERLPDGRSRCGQSITRIFNDCVNSDRYHTYVPTLLNQEEGSTRSILSGAWDNELVGSSVVILTTETDDLDIRIIEETITSSNEKKISGSFGFKVKIPIVGTVDAKVGTDTQFKNTKETKLDYPDGDIQLTRRPIYYHQPFFDSGSGEFFGYNIERTRVLTGETYTPVDRSCGRSCPPVTVTEDTYIDKEYGGCGL